MEIGKVIHYYDKISVAVVELLSPLSVQDRVMFIGKDREFEQLIDSMQIQHISIESADAGQQVAIKVNERVRCGDTLCSPDEKMAV